MTATPESELVERLRKCAEIVHLEPGRSPLEEAYIDAAAAIERLAQERDEARSVARDNYQNLLECLRVKDAVVAERDALRERAEAAEREIAEAGVEFNDERLAYVTLQIPRGVWLEYRAALEQANAPNLPHP